MAKFTDQCGRILNLDITPKRIISLVPSQTELLFELGLENEVVGITQFCVHPANWFLNKTRVGGTKKVSIEKVKGLSPDLIIANKEENIKEQVEALEKVAPVWISDVNTYEEALAMIQKMGEITGTTAKATNLITTIESNFSLLPTPLKNKRAAYFIWKDPYMVAGGNTFINAMMKKCGYTNVFEDKKRYPVVFLQQVKENNTELLLLSSEPYPFKQKHINEIKEKVPGIEIQLVDGEMYSWYGSRMLYAAGYFATHDF